MNMKKISEWGLLLLGVQGLIAFAVFVAGGDLSSLAWPSVAC